MNNTKSLPSLLRNFLTKGHERSVKAKKNIFASFFIRASSIIISLILVPITINYVNPTRYGIWLTLSSIIAWFSFFDIGLGNGLRNRFAEALAKNDKEIAKVYVSTTYAILTIIIIIVLLIFVCINPLLNWAKILNTQSEMGKELSILALLVFVFFCLRFVFQLIATILTADQKPATASLLKLIGNGLSLLIIYILTKTTKGSLIYLGIALGLAPVIVMVISNLYLFKGDYKEFKPSLAYVKFRYTKNLMSLGIKFFFIHIAVIVLYQSSNIIIAQLYGPIEVTPYNIAYKYFHLVPMFFAIIMTPFWSAFTEGYVKKDFIWIKKTINDLIKIWFIFIAIVIIMLVFSDLFYRIWVGSVVKIPFVLSLIMSIYAIFLTFGSIFVMFINGIGKIKLQLYSSSIATILFIPLAIFFAKNLNFGISGVILAIVISNFYGPILAPIQYNKIINNKATGIWNK